MLAMTRGLAGCSGGSSGGSAGDATLRGPNSLPDPSRAAGAADSTLPFDHVWW